MGEYCDDKFWVAEAMIKHGGGFVTALGEALRKADLENTEKIKQAWPELWKTYSEVGESMVGTDAGKLLAS